MKPTYLIAIFTLLFTMVWNSQITAKTQSLGEGKQAILLVHFGTTVPEAKVALENIEEEFTKAFPNQEVRWAFTAKMIRKKLKRQGERIDSPAEALAKLGEEGYKTVFVQSLHTIPGSEYHDLVETVEAFQNMPKGTQRVELGAPLLFSHEDTERTVKALIENIPSERKAKEAVLFMGHGTHHFSNIYYPGLSYYLQDIDPNIHMATVEGYPDLNHILPTLKANKIKTVWLMPFMSVAGDHARNDMMGNEPESWKSQLEVEGFEVKVCLKGTAEFDSIVSIWVDHLKEIMK